MKWLCGTGEGRLLASAATWWLGALMAFAWTRGSLTGWHGVGLLVGLVLGPGLIGRWASVRPFDRWVLAMLLSLMAVLGALTSLRAAHGYRPLTPGVVETTASVLGDAEPTGHGGWRVEARFESNERVQLEAWGRPADILARSQPGDQLLIGGRIRPIGERPWLRIRHIVARVAVDEAEFGPSGGGGPVRSVVEAVRAAVLAGGKEMDFGQRALYSGLVLGDDRFQHLGQRLRFRQAGLAHLLAVSGQNVAFVLAAARPGLSVLGPRSRLAATLGLLTVFAMATRLEPSVLRASSTAAIACWASWSGRTGTGVMVLAASVICLLLLDPFLAESIGFQLSVVASFGILVLGLPIERRLPFFPVLAGPLSVTVAAQLAVTPLLILHFSPPSLAAIPANLATGWAAGAVMTWGLTAGIIVGALPAGVAEWAQMPASALLWWLDHVAAMAARMPAPRMTMALVAALLMVAVVFRRSVASVRVVLVSACLVLMAVATPRAPRHPSTCGPGVRWIPQTTESSGGRSLLILDAQSGERGLEQCLAAGIRNVDLLVIEGGGRRSGTVAVAAAELFGGHEILAPPLHAVPGAQRVVSPTTIESEFGWVTVVPKSDGRGLLVSVGGFSG